MTHRSTLVLQIPVVVRNSHANCRTKSTHMETCYTANALRLTARVHKLSLQHTVQCSLTRTRTEVYSRSQEEMLLRQMSSRCRWSLPLPFARPALSTPVLRPRSTATSHANRNRNDVPSKPHALPLQQQLPSLEVRSLHPLVAASASTVVAASLHEMHTRPLFLCNIDTSAMSVNSSASTQSVDPLTKLDRR